MSEGSPKHNEEIEKWQKMAKWALENGNLEQAEDYTSKLLESDPFNLDYVLDHAEVAAKLSTIYKPRYQEILNAYNVISGAKDSLEPDRYKNLIARQITTVAEVMSERFDAVFQEKSALAKQSFSNCGLASAGRTHAAEQSMDFKAAFEKNYKDMLMVHVEFWHKFDEQEMLNDPIYKPAYLKLCLFAMKLLTQKYQLLLPYRDPYMVKMRSFTENKTAFSFLKKYTARMKAYYPSDTKLPGSGGCYVATAVYGSYDCPEVWVLRRFRDDILSRHHLGRLFIKTYYAVSPTLVQWFGNSRIFTGLWHGPLDRLVKKLKDKGIRDTPYSD